MKKKKHNLWQLKSVKSHFFADFGEILHVGLFSLSEYHFDVRYDDICSYDVKGDTSFARMSVKPNHFLDEFGCTGLTNPSITGDRNSLFRDIES